MLYLAQLMFWSSSLLLQLLVAALLLLCLLSRDNPWRLCSSYVDISSTIGFPCTHLRKSTLLIVLCLPRPSAGSITYTLSFPCFCITRYTVLSHASCILFLPNGLFLVYTRSPIINGASLALHHLSLLQGGISVQTTTILLPLFFFFFFYRWHQRDL